MQHLGMLDDSAARCTAVFFLDLDRFKNVNDTLGHSAGDDLLVVVAERLKAAVRPDDTVARLGGDEFVILAQQVPDRHTAVCIARRACDALSRPISISGQEISVGCSIGIAFAGGEAPEVLLKKADMALYRAKGSASDQWAAFYDPAWPGPVPLSSRAAAS